MMRSLVAFIALAWAGGAPGQGTYPNRPVSMVVGFAPGGGTDTVARILAKNVGDAIGQQMLVENKAGAGGNIATDYVAHAAPDGYTLLLGNVGSHTLAEYVQLARSKPGTITYASSGIGGAGHLAGELLKMMAKIDIVHVPYKGGGPAMQGMLGGQVASFFATPVSVGGHIKSGKVRAIATTGPKRAALLPDVPTVAESGYPGYEAMNWYAYVAPAKTPKDVIDRLNREIVKALAAPEVIALLEKQGLEPSSSSPEELARYIASEYETWGKVVKQAGIKAQ